MLQTHQIVKILYIRHENIREQLEVFQEKKKFQEYNNKFKFIAFLLLFITFCLYLLDYLFDFLVSSLYFLTFESNGFFLFNFLLRNCNL